MSNSWIREIDRDELRRIVDKRVARAETAVLRDYLSQKGAEGDELENAIDELRKERQDAIPSKETLTALEQKASDLEAKLRGERVNSSARMALARLGVSDEYAGDVLKLAEDGLKSACGNADPARAESDARTAIEAVVARLPGLVEGAQPSENNPAVGYAGSAGNFPRADSMGSMQQELDRARQTGNNAAAVAIISQAAKKGIRLR